GPVQVVRGGVRLPLERQDWRGFGEAERERRLEELLAAERERGFGLDGPPLQRLILLRTGESAWRLVWNHHHLLLDGWSLSTLTGEVFAAYGAFLRGEEPRLGRPRPYRDYIAWLERQDLAPAEAYWRERLAGFRPGTPPRLRPPQGAAAGGPRGGSQPPAGAVARGLQGVAPR